VDLWYYRKTFLSRPLTNIASICYNWKKVGGFAVFLH
jgi:hypothetical protein